MSEVRLWCQRSGSDVRGQVVMSEVREWMSSSRNNAHITERRVLVLENIRCGGSVSQTHPVVSPWHMLNRCPEQWSVASQPSPERPEFSWKWSSSSNDPTESYIHIYVYISTYIHVQTSLLCCTPGRAERHRRDRVIPREQRNSQKAAIYANANRDSDMLIASPRC